MTNDVPMRHSIGAVSGEDAEHTAFTVLRWDARRSPAHDSSDTSFFIGDGDNSRLLHTVQGPFGGVWRAPSGAAFFSSPGLIQEVRAQGADVHRKEHAVAGLFPEMWGRYDDEAFAWGVNSMLRWDGASWLPCPSPGDVYAMHGARRDLTFAVGRQGLVARWDGSSWRTMEPAPGGDLIAVHVVDDGEMYAIAKPGVILEGTSLGWRVKVDTGKKLRGIAKFAGRLLVAVETEGLFELVDGKLAPYKTSFKPHQIECRSGLVIAAAEHVVRSSDGEKFRGVALKVLRELVDRHPPHW